eukprot:3845213-Rhodomonas_salina.1
MHEQGLDPALTPYNHTAMDNYRTKAKGHIYETYVCVYYAMNSNESLQRVCVNSGAALLLCNI